VDPTPGKRRFSSKTAGHRSCQTFPTHEEVSTMLWFLAVLMGGLGVGYVTVRRKRKAQQPAK